ncbi:tyrosine-type recombinase/integrase [Phenylobacterium sp. LH3H17]|uniref:tyrosine-type recombinase/integrase n=1 Tax=Phenylobacterium sp. LH3H17 TaxID=2903901 RepID=UPI0020C97A31|nr:tyrosine-type recombinase/integrase [Phenylobacterium sp. LH3H17]UTP41434.1 tyrosine-type recombinase/integrase [Phenylobacterium sp. LH3H17]
MAPLPGVHRVRKVLADGVAEYWYAWRGGPRILSARALTERALSLRVAAASIEASRLFHEHTERRSPNADGFVAGLIYAWQESAEFALFSPRTKKDLRKHLGTVRDKFGGMPVRAMASRHFRREVMEWRGEHARTPCTADQLVSALVQLMKWAREAGKSDAEFGPWTRLYRVDRSSIIWEPHELEALCKHATPELKRAALLAAFTGLRKGDLLKLTWADVGTEAITRTTAKRRRVVHIPLTTEVKSILASCPRVSPVVLTDRTGKPWKAPTLEKQFGLARNAAGVVGKRWHDLRGTYATSLVRAGVETPQLARIMGWGKETAEAVATRYVGSETVALAALERLKAGSSK